MVDSGRNSWHQSVMTENAQQTLEVLYHEAVSLGERARRWFDGPGLAQRGELPIDAQAAVAVESLDTTARLLAVMAWLLDPGHFRGQVPAMVLDRVEETLPEGSPLAGTPGGEVAIAARRLLMRAQTRLAEGQQD
jgi:hypothetical protein